MLWVLIKSVWRNKKINYIMFLLFKFLIKYTVSSTIKRIYRFVSPKPSLFADTVNPRYSDNICSRKRCHYNEFAVVENT